MTGNPTNPLLVVALVALVAAAAAWPPVQDAGHVAFQSAADAFQVKFFDSQSLRFSCM